jgi:hypothetical protein
MACLALSWPVPERSIIVRYAEILFPTAVPRQTYNWITGAQMDPPKRRTNHDFIAPGHIRATA